MTRPFRVLLSSAILACAWTARPVVAGDHDLIRIVEFGTMCANGDTAIQFVVLEPIGPGQVFSSALGLKALDRFGNIRFQKDPAVGPFFGDPWPEHFRFTLASETAAPFGMPYRWSSAPLSLDPIGGTLVLYASDIGIVDQVAYGAIGSAPAPLPGHSAKRGVDGLMHDQFPPGPSDFPIQWRCPARPTLIQWDAANLYTDAAQMDTVYSAQTPDPYGRYFVTRFDYATGNALDSASAYSPMIRNTVEMNDIYFVAGGLAGAPVEITARWRVHGHGYASPSGPLGWIESWARINVEQANGRAWRFLGYAGIVPGGNAVDTTLEVTFTRAVLEPFELRASLGTQCRDGRAILQGELAFVGLPPGLQVLSSKGYGTASTVSVPGSSPPPGVLWLETPRPNPTLGEFSVGFTLEDRSPAKLELFDLAGRRIESRDVGAMGAGRHSASFGARAPLAPGLYFVKLERGGIVGSSRIVVRN